MGSPTLSSSKWFTWNGPHVVYVAETKPPEQCSFQELINELVRKTLQKPTTEEIQKQVADSWFAIEET